VVSVRETSSWPAWLLLVPLAVVVGWFVFRWLSALAFRHVLLGGLVRRYGWRADLPGGSGRAAFNDQERRRRAKAWEFLRKGRIREGYQSGVFGKRQTGAWHPEVTLTGMWRGRQFTASQIRRYELTSGETTHRKVRRRASLSLAGSFPIFEARATRSGQVQAPPPVAALVRAKRWRFRGFRADGSGLSMELGRRLRRRQLLAALDYLSDAADALTRMP
jgi:hypothetical protein